MFVRVQVPPRVQKQSESGSESEHSHSVFLCTHSHTNKNGFFIIDKRKLVYTEEYAKRDEVLQRDLYLKTAGGQRFLKSLEL